MDKENIGNYRVCKHQVGIGGTIETNSNHKSRAEVLKTFNDIQKESNWIYYC